MCWFNSILKNKGSNNTKGIGGIPRSNNTQEIGGNT